MLSAPVATPGGKKIIGATIRIGREIRCLPYAGFFYLLSCQKKPLTQNQMTRKRSEVTAKILGQ